MANDSVTQAKKISFQTVDMAVSLSESEYEYLKFVCLQTLRPSDDVLRQQIRDLTIPGLLTFDQWRQQQTTPTLVGESGGEGGVVVEASEAKVDAAIANGKAVKPPRRASASGQSSRRGKGAGELNGASAGTVTAEVVVDVSAEPQPHHGIDTAVAVAESTPDAAAKPKRASARKPSSRNTARKKTATPPVAPLASVVAIADSDTTLNEVTNDVNQSVAIVVPEVEIPTVEAAVKPKRSSRPASQRPSTAKSSRKPVTKTDATAVGADADAATVAPVAAKPKRKSSSRSSTRKGSTTRRSGASSRRSKKPKASSNEG